MSSPFNKFYAFIDELSKGTHNLQTDVFKVALTDTAPNAATDTTWNTTTYPAPAAAAGYTAGGNTLTTTSAATTAGVFKLVLGNSVFTASGGNIGPFRYAVIYNSSKSNKLVAYYDRGSELTLSDPDNFTLDVNSVAGDLFTLA